MFQAVDRNTGVVKWSYDISQDGDQNSFHGRMRIDGELVFVGTDVPTGHVYAFEKETGKVRWKFDAGKGVSTDILVSGDRLVALTMDGLLVCLDRQTGEEYWSFRLDFPDSGPESMASPGLLDNTVYLVDFGGALHAFDLADGTVKWSRDFDTAVTNHLLVLAEGIYLGTDGERLHHLNPETGDALSVIEIPGKVIGRIAVTEQSFVFFVQGASEAQVISLDRESGTPRWSHPAPNSQWTPNLPFVSGNRVMFGVKGATALDIAEGTLLWSLDIPGTVKTFAEYENRLYIGTQEGTLHVFDRP